MSQRRRSSLDNLCIQCIDIVSLAKCCIADPCTETVTEKPPLSKFNVSLDVLTNAMSVIPISAF